MIRQISAARDRHRTAQNSIAQTAHMQRQQPIVCLAHSLRFASLMSAKGNGMLTVLPSALPCLEREQRARHQSTHLYHPMCTCNAMSAITRVQIRTHMQADASCCMPTHAHTHAQESMHTSCCNPQCSHMRTPAPTATRLYTPQQTSSLDARRAFTYCQPLVLARRAADHQSIS